MHDKPQEIPRLNLMLAALLHYGTWIAFIVTALGLLAAQRPARAHAPFLAMLDGAHLLTAGIALFILLPVMRVALMLAVFVRERDYRFVAIACIVLIAIFSGVVLEAYLA